MKIATLLQHACQRSRANDLLLSYMMLVVYFVLFPR